MSAALSRYTNPAAHIGHAGHTAPILDDARLLFLADLPAFPAGNDPATEGPRSQLLELELAHLQRVNARLQGVLGRVFEETRDFPDEKPYSADSYLPPRMVAEIAEALHTARSA
jgi:hypothetical protein